jgi:hypothetical protein
MSANQGVNRLAIATEYPPANEPAYVEKMIEDLQGQLTELYPEGKTLRQAHPKMHGCVHAEFTVPEGLDKDLRVGVFKDAKTYKASIRFSNANTEIKHDYDKDVRGMAIKLFDVEGKMEHIPTGADDPDLKTQDFVLINHEVFMSKNVAEFHQIIHALTKGKLSLILFLLNPMHWSILGRLIKTQKRCEHVLDTGYWSTTPYLFGPGRAVKYHVEPANDGAVHGGAERSDENYLRTNMKKTLAEKDVYFDFFVQFQTDANAMPIEDPTVKWESPFVKVARIKILKQNFDTPEQDHYGNDLSFSPWHCLSEHRPLGGLNRARRAVYYRLSDFWHGRNDAHTKK